MSDYELLQLIIESVIREDNPIPEKVILDNNFIRDKRNTEFIELYNSSGYKTNDWEWHQIARFALKKGDAQKYMYDKLWNLLLKHRGHFYDYFELETELGTCPIPNPLTELNRFESLYHEFFDIFRNITNRIHFDYPEKEYSGPSLQGNIDWQKTIQESETRFPINFFSTIPYRKFDTSENVLLALCVKWMNHECNRILELDFKEPLDDQQKNILMTISDRTKHLILNFPFQDVIKEAMKYWNLENNDPKILSLENKTRKKIQDNIILNKNYSRLLQWIDKFRNLNLMMVSEQIPVKNLLKSQVAQDTIFEAWIFFEFIEFFSDNGMLRHLNMNKENKPYYFEFEFDGQIFTFYYEREFTTRGNEPFVWALQHKPDFIIMLDNKVIAVMDAKNFSKDQDPQIAMNKMLSYMTNFNTKIGILFFPYLPQFWDDMQVKERRSKLVPFYTKNNPQLTPEQISSMQKPEANENWLDLSSEFQSISPPDSIKSYTNPKDEKMKLYLMRMEPQDNILPLRMKNQTIHTVFEIIQGILITVKS